MVVSLIRLFGDRRSRLANKEIPRKKLNVLFVVEEKTKHEVNRRCCFFTYNSKLFAEVILGFPLRKLLRFNPGDDSIY